MSAAAGQCACPHCIHASSSSTAAVMIYHQSAPPSADNYNAQVSAILLLIVLLLLLLLLLLLYKRHGIHPSDSYIIPHSLDNSCTSKYKFSLEHLLSVSR